MFLFVWFKSIGRSALTLFLLACLSSPLLADSYPDMLGVWRGDVRLVQAGVSGIAKGGMMVSDVKMTVTIEAQDGESFMGKTRNTQMTGSQVSNRVWGTIRSIGKEAIFITSAGARGQIWFENEKRLEFCVTNLQEKQATAYCANLDKDTPAEES
jgi:hypothetical protein